MLKTRKKQRTELGKETGTAEPKSLLKLKNKYSRYRDPLLKNGSKRRSRSKLV